MDPAAVVTASDRQAVAEGCRYDPAKAERVVRFIETFCCHTKGRWYGRPFGLLEWQRELIHRLYGWVRPDGTRRFRACYVEIPKKNGKTELVSALTLYHLLADGEKGAEIYLCASTRKQAGLIFKDACMMIESSPELRKRLVIKDSFHEKVITYRPTRSEITVLSSDAPSADGKSSSLTVFDELHRQEGPELWNVMEYAGSARHQPLLLAITTAGVDRKSVCWRQHEHARKVATDIVTDTAFLGVVYGADPEVDNLDDPAVWARVNPSWGETIQPDDFAREAERAKEDPIQRNNFLRLRLNVWTEADSRFFDRESWQACGEAFDPAELLGRVCYAGLDLSNVSDITAFVLVFPMPDGTVRVLPHYWIPRDYALERMRRDMIPYLEWGRAGKLTLTAGATIDYDFVKRAIVNAAKRYRIKRINCDPYNATQIIIQLGSEGLPIEAMRQDFKHMNAPCKELLRLVQAGELRHGGDPVLAWMADNARVITDPNENLKISRKHSRDKVDGLVALAMGIAAMNVNRPPPAPTIAFV